MIFTATFYILNDVDSYSREIIQEEMNRHKDRLYKNLYIYYGENDDPLNIIGNVIKLFIEDDKAKCIVDIFPCNKFLIDKIFEGKMLFEILTTKDDLIRGIKLIDRIEWKGN